MKEPGAGGGWGRSVKAAEEHSSFPCSSGSLLPCASLPAVLGAGGVGISLSMRERTGCQGSRNAV